MSSLDGRIVPTINGFKEFDNGGKGSGNFGHSGRPGQVGGSGDGRDFGTGLKESDKDLIGSSEGSLGVTKKEFKAAKKQAKERAGEMSVSKTDYGTYIAEDKFYRREFQTKREADAFKGGYDYADKAKDFTHVDYIRITEGRTNKWDVMYKKTDVGVHESASFNNPLEAQRWTEGYNSKISAIESEVPSGVWKKKNSLQRNDN